MARSIPSSSDEVTTIRVLARPASRRHCGSKRGSSSSRQRPTMSPSTLSITRSSARAASTPSSPGSAANRNPRDTASHQRSRPWSRRAAASEASRTSP